MKRVIVSLATALMLLLYHNTACAEDVQLSVNAYSIPINSNVVFTFSNVDPNWEITISETSVDGSSNLTYSSQYSYDEIEYSNGDLIWWDWSPKVTDVTYQFHVRSGAKVFSWDKPIKVSWYSLGKVSAPSVSFLNNPKTGQDLTLLFHINSSIDYQNLTYWYWIEKQFDHKVLNNLQFGECGTGSNSAVISGLALTVPGKYRIYFHAVADGYDDSNTFSKDFVVSGSALKSPPLTIKEPFYLYDLVSGQISVSEPAINDCNIWALGVTEPHEAWIQNNRICTRERILPYDDNHLYFTFKMLNESGAMQWTEWVDVPIVINRVDSIQLELPHNLTRVEASAFENTSIISVQIPKSCRYIGSKAFANCKNLRRVDILSDKIEFADDAFDGSNRVVFYTSGNNIPASVYQFAESHDIYVAWE